MKKLFSLLLALLMILSLAACEIDLGDSNEDDTVEAYIRSAERLIENGDLEGAKAVLEEALDEVDSEELEELLEEVEEAIDREDNDDEKPLDQPEAETTAPYEDILETEPVVTEAPPSVESELPVICVFYYNGATRFALKEDLQDPSKYMEPEEVSRRYGNNYIEEECRNTYGDNLLYKNDDVQYRINLFLSNFAETHFMNYPCSDYAMLYYALNHNKINNLDAISETRDYYCMDKSAVNRVLTMYFGKTLNPTSYETYYPNAQDTSSKVIYDGSKFCFPLADGVLSDYVAVADYLHKNPDGTYYVSYVVYHATYGDMENYYGATAQAAENSKYLDYDCRGEAVVTDYTRLDKTQSYQLVWLSTFE